jgi:hypothetical protein
MTSDFNWRSTILGIITIIILGLISYFLFHEITQAPWQFVTILIALIGGLISFAGNLQLQIRNDQKGKKTEIYDGIIDLFFDSIFAEKIGKQPPSEIQLTQGFANLTPDLILWASDDVLSLFIEFRQQGNISSHPTEQILLFGKLLLAMRKDLGHQNKGLSEKLILGTFVNDLSSL